MIKLWSPAKECEVFTVIRQTLSLFLFGITDRDCPNLANQPLKNKQKRNSLQRVSEQCASYCYPITTNSASNKKM